MVEVRLYFDDERFGERFRRSTFRQRDQVLAATRSAATRAEDEFLKRARAQIANAGNFGKRWQDGLRVTRSEGGGFIRIDVMHDLATKGFWVHQKGAVIKGKPLLWIPTSWASDAQGVRARDYPGQLVRVDRKTGGAPLLLNPASGEVKYTGHASVKVPKRFRTLEIAREVMSKMAQFYNQAFKKG